MESNGARHTQGASARPDPSKLLIRLALVLAAVAVFLVLFKPAASVENKLQAVLDAQVRAIHAGDLAAFEALYDARTGTWWEYQRATFDNYRPAAQAGQPGEARVFPDLHVVEAAAQTNTAWAVVTRGDDPDAPRQVVFFQRVAGDWLIAPPDPTYWGEPGAYQSLYFVWRYREADDAWIRALAPEMDAAWGQIAADFDVVLPSHLVDIEVCYTHDCRWEQPSVSATRYVIPLDEFATRTAGNPGPAPALSPLRTFTPMLIGRSADDVEGALAQALAAYLGALAVGGGDETRMVGASVLLQAIYHWEAAQVTRHEPDWVAPVLAQAIASDSVLSFDEMSVLPGRDSYALASAGAYALVEYLVTRYDRRILPTLLRAAGVRSGVSTAVQDLLPEGANIPAFEEQWRDYLRTTYGP